MSLTAKNWKLSSYTNSTWTDLVNASAGPVTIKSLIVATGANAATVKVQITDSGGSALSTIVPDESLAASGGYRLDIAVIVLNANEKLQVQSSASGVTFIANGVQ